MKMYQLPLKKWILSGLLCLLTSMALAKESADAQVFIGVVDYAQDSQASQYGVQYLTAERWTPFDFRPVIGLMRTRYASHYVFAGLTRESKFSTKDTGFLLSVDFAPGLYLHGGNEDVNLGFWLQFRSGVNLVYEFADHTRIGLGYHHLSNASLAEENPGTETLTITYSVRL
ncbi:acyloxyacyl hydrolase [Salinispirillum marinum]|uniref:Acyloxyacyl hydrolase n=2 Tax=Saccharospirillaceae TaxID=255527 RepID=A0ABV8BFU9_9GAMM